MWRFYHARRLATSIASLPLRPIRPRSTDAAPDTRRQALQAGHIPGSVGFNWQTQLQDQTRRDIPTKAEFERLLSAAGIQPDTTVIVHGDTNNWFAAYAFRLFKYYGHQDVRLLNGGRQKWHEEGDKEVTTEPTKVGSTSYRATSVNAERRARSPQAAAARGGRNRLYFLHD